MQSSAANSTYVRLTSAIGFKAFLVHDEGLSCWWAPRLYVLEEPFEAETAAFGRTR